MPDTNIKCCSGDLNQRRLVHCSSPCLHFVYLAESPGCTALHRLLVLAVHRSLLLLLLHCLGFDIIVFGVMQHCVI